MEWMGGEQGMEKRSGHKKGNILGLSGRLNFGSCILMPSWSCFRYNEYVFFAASFSSSVKVFNGSSPFSMLKYIRQTSSGLSGTFSFFGAPCCSQPIFHLSLLSVYQRASCSRAFRSCLSHSYCISTQSSACHSTRTSSDRLSSQLNRRCVAAFGLRWQKNRMFASGISPFFPFSWSSFADPACGQLLTEGLVALAGWDSREASRSQTSHS